MFETDDWDLDQDFLNDVDNSNICCTEDNDEVEPKRRKIEVLNDPVISSNYNVDWCEKSANKTESQNDDKMSRKDLILGMFNKKVSNGNIFPMLSENNNSTRSQSNNTQNCDSNPLPRKHIVLEMLKKKNIENTLIENTETLNLQKNKLHIKSNNDNCIQQQHNFNSFQKSLVDNSSNKFLEMKNKSIFKLPHVQPNKKMALIRRFPGPAGLLPDDIDTNIPISYLNSLDESKELIEQTEANLPEYCSQTTKNLFTEGAWQSMLDDLPDGFLKGSEIATVKQMANVNGHSCSKVDFLAGIIEHIDHSHDNPPIVLKDFTDSIQGIVHRDIPLKYPGLLESNVVILLRNAGLLKTFGSFACSKYHILISPSSLVAIYSNKGKIDCIGNVSNEKMEEKQTQMKEDEVFPKVVEEQLHKILIHSSKEDSTEWNTSRNETINSDFIDDSSFSASTNDITNAQSEKGFISANSKDLKDVKQNNKQQSFKEIPMTNEKQEMQNKQLQKSRDLLKALKKFSPNVDNIKKLAHESRILRTNNKNKEPEMLCDNSYVTNSVEIDVDRDNVNSHLVEMETEKAELNVSCTEKSKLSIRSKLMQFENTNVLSPPQTFESKHSLNLNINNDTGQDNKLIMNSNSEFNILCTTENDSDDEMLSQIDMDNICSDAGSLQ
ncbi:uncharacterized protein LOC144468681 [Augochlora pura]